MKVTSMIWGTTHALYQMHVSVSLDGPSQSTAVLQNVVKFSRVHGIALTTNETVDQAMIPPPAGAVLTLVSSTVPNG